MPIIAISKELFVGDGTLWAKNCIKRIEITKDNEILQCKAMTRRCPPDKIGLHGSPILILF